MKINTNYKYFNTDDHYRLSPPILLKYFKKSPCRHKKICINCGINSFFEHLVFRSHFRNNFFNVIVRKRHFALCSLFYESIKKIFPFFGAFFMKLKAKDVVNIDVHGCHFVTFVFALITTIHNIQNNFLKLILFWRQHK